MPESRPVGRSETSDRHTDLRATEPDKYPPQFDPEIVKAIHWCRLGRVRPDGDSAFHRAKQLGLLAQDGIWRATEQGEGVLIALGLLKGKPEPRRVLLTMLWASCERYPTPQFVRAWSEGIDDMMYEEAQRIRAEAEEWFKDFGDEQGWRFWTTTEYVDVPNA